ncbi:TIGR01459 family HAD-type hydrolase [Sphingomonas sp. HDW15A]|uniref:TIGR01459 family HAD-type hydrolase n=1 Tax=Sphingomonas sp. HDW15A TaxID=2714942 RepID=UPI00140A609D|nr:TIGR01459 family HAD-type hydrolase [Sphingomonas sp. HDW15A]QIK95860.1 TIGR01459 family HAD-type hydrolase [Sphingomonas sp. HDW15A]
MSFLDALPERYRLILCDVWGVVHDGVTIFPGAAERLQRWEGEGRTVILLTNAPRSEEAVAQQLDRLGLPRDAWTHIATSGEAGIAGLLAAQGPVGFIGSEGDREILEGRGITIDAGGEFTDLAVTGIDGIRMNAMDYLPELEDALSRNATMHCLNPDMLVIRGGVPEACAGAIAEIYENLGGQVEYYGKPHAHIYEHALKVGGNPTKEEVLAVGDGLPTDVLGAARFGLDCVFVRGGIHAGEPFPSDFASQYGLGSWAPVAQVDSLS